MKAIALLLALGVLVGCEGIGREAVGKAKEVKDEEAIVAVNTQCAVGVGALIRQFTPEVQEGVWKTCAALNTGGGTNANPVPLAELGFAASE